MKILNKKVVRIVLIIIVGILFFLYGLCWGIMKYDQWHGQKRVRELAEELERIEREQYEKKKVDTIGGQTPQETLNMFISAVENGDYELASKYMITEKRVKEKEELLALKQENNLSWFLNVLKKAEADGNIENGYFRMKAKTD